MAAPRRAVSMSVEPAAAVNLRRSTDLGSTEPLRALLCPRTTGGFEDPAYRKDFP